MPSQAPEGKNALSVNGLRRGSKGLPSTKLLSVKSPF